MERGDGDTTSDDTPPVSPTAADAEQRPSTLAADRYRCRPGWASRWVRGRVVARHRDGTEVGVTGSAALTWIAFGPSPLDVRATAVTWPSRAPATSLSDAERAPDVGPGTTVAELVKAIETGWPDVGSVTAVEVEAALGELLASTLVERIQTLDIRDVSPGRRFYPIG